MKELEKYFIFLCFNRHPISFQVNQKRKTVELFRIVVHLSLQLKKSTICYAAGYVPYKLLLKYEESKDVVEAVQVIFLCRYYSTCAAKLTCIQ